MLLQRFLRGKPVTAGWAFEPARDAAGASEGLVLAGRIGFAGCVEVVHGVHLLSSPSLRTGAPRKPLSLEDAENHALAEIAGLLHGLFRPGFCLRPLCDQAVELLIA